MKFNEELKEKIKAAKSADELKELLKSSRELDDDELDAVNGGMLEDGMYDMAIELSEWSCFDESTRERYLQRVQNMMNDGNQYTYDDVVNTFFEF